MKAIRDDLKRHTGQDDCVELPKRDKYNPSLAAITEHDRYSEMGTEGNNLMESRRSMALSKSTRNKARAAPVKQISEMQEEPSPQLKRRPIKN